MSLEPIAAEDLSLGMYVAQLDRPWLETPFLFQGFTIKDTAEIAELQRHCRHVYIERAKSIGVAATKAVPVRSQSKPKERSWSFKRLKQIFRRDTLEPVATCAKPGEFYVNTVSTSTELPQARAILTQASSLFAEMMAQVRQGAKLDVTVLEQAVSPMLESLLRNGDAMAWLARIKQTDDYTYGHSVSCSIYAIAFGRHLGLPKEDLHALGLGGLLLDVGKTKIPRELLGKSGELTAAEMRMMRDHVRYGLDILEGSKGVDSRVLSMVRSHHERYDGSGYPDGLKGAHIPVFARIGGIVDFYDALITPRVYAAAVSAFDAVRDLHRGANRLFQSEMVEQFIQAVGVFPNGALVELSTGEVGIVVEQNRVRRLRPKVALILDAGKLPLAEPKTLDLKDVSAELGEPGATWIDRGLEIGAYGIDPARYYL